MEDMYKTFVSQEVVQGLSDRLDAFSSLEHVSYLQNTLLPKIEEFSRKIEAFHEDNDNMRECIRQFDESISIKANKSSFTIMREEFEDKYIHIDRWEEVLDKFDELKSDIEL